MLKRMSEGILIILIVIFASGCPKVTDEGEGEVLEGEIEGEAPYEGELLEGEIEIAVTEGEDPVSDLLESIEQDIYVKINEERIAAGLSALFLDKSVRNVARAHSQDMADKDYFAHTNLEGVGPANRILNAGIDFRYFGENLAYTYGFSDPASWVVDGWMDSPGHRDNIVSRNFTHTGIGVACDSKGAFYFTQEFVGY